MSFELNQLLPWISTLIVPLAGWAWKLEMEVKALRILMAADNAAIRADVQKNMHELEGRMVSQEMLDRFDQRIEKRLDRIEGKLDKALQKEPG